MTTWKYFLFGVLGVTMASQEAPHAVWLLLSFGNQLKVDAPAELLPVDLGWSKRDWN